MKTTKQIKKMKLINEIIKQIATIHIKKIKIYNFNDLDNEQKYERIKKFDINILECKATNFFLLIIQKLKNNSEFILKLFCKENEYYESENQFKTIFLNNLIVESCLNEHFIAKGRTSKVVSREIIISKSLSKKMNFKSKENKKCKITNVRIKFMIMIIIINCFIQFKFYRTNIAYKIYSNENFRFEQYFENEIKILKFIHNIENLKENDRNSFFIFKKTKILFFSYLNFEQEFQNYFITIKIQKKM